jgi:hypothetical protein
VTWPQFFSKNVSPGTDVMILNHGRPKIWRKNCVFFAQTTATFLQKLSITLVFEKNAKIIFSKNRQKLAKIGKNWQKLVKIGKNWQKLAKIGKNRKNRKNR